MMKQILFLFTAMITFGLSAQTVAPGGVSNPEIWFMTVPQTGDLQGKYYWKDFSGDSVKLLVRGNNGKLTGGEYNAVSSDVHTYNFNPAISLISNSNESEEFHINKANLSHSTIISVWGADKNFDIDAFLYALNGRPDEGYIFTKDKVIHSIESGKAALDYGSDAGKDLLIQNTTDDMEHALRIAAYSLTLPPNTSVWGENEQAVVSIGQKFDSNNSVNTSTFNISDPINTAFSGYTPEFIIYNRMLSPLERSKVETYLAVKYGLTLGKSYIGSADQLIWDLDANTGHNNRITGYGRDDQSGMFQKVSATSCEEANYFSYGSDYPSNNSGNFYNLPGPYRLLVMGREDASPMEDGQYVIFGDNGGALTATAPAGISGMKLMNRSWALNTNITPVIKQVLQLWNTKGLDISTVGYKTQATKPGSSTDTFGYLVSASPLLGKDGYLSWTITGSRRGPLTVKFGTGDPQLTGGSYDYGYSIDASGKVYKIIKDVILSQSICTVNVNQKIEVAKEGNTVYLRSNGTRSYDYDITVDSADTEQDFYGSIMINQYNQDDITLSDIRRGGFEDTGNRVELSYDSYRAGEFSNYRTNGKSYLVIDPTGKGNFSGQDVVYIPSDEVDESRSKIIFNNIFWDSDGNGKDMFTFAYRVSDLAIAVTGEDQTCINDVITPGKINIKIIYGNNGFSCHLVNTETQDERSESFDTKSYVINDVPAGTYSLTVSDITSGDSILQTVTIEDNGGCAPVLAPALPKPTEPDPDSNLTLNNPAGTYTVLANLQMDSPQAVTFVAYDMAGKPVSIVDQSSPRKIQEVQLNVHRSGVYIIKAISATGEQTGKIIVK